MDDERLQAAGEQPAGSVETSSARKPPLSPEQSARARQRWGVVKGAVDKSRTFNRSASGDEAGARPTDKTVAAAFADAGARRSTRGGTKRDESKTHTAGGAWLANQMGEKGKIGNVEEYTTIDQRATHLKQFLTGAHAFITPWVHKAIFSLHEDPKNNWGSWGADYNFIAPLSEADKLIEAASAPGARGLFDLEVALGVPEGQWVRGCAPTTRSTATKSWTQRS